jgi:hypothetical protein
METGGQMIERVRKRFETEPFPVLTLTKMEWAQIIGMCIQCAEYQDISGTHTRKEDIRWAAVTKLGSLLGMGEFEVANNA